MAIPKYLVITFEAAFEMDTNISESIKDALEALRGTGAARAVSYVELDDDKDYETWYNRHGITEVEIHVPQKVVFD